MALFMMAAAPRMATPPSRSATSNANKTLGKVDYHERAEFPHGILPTKKDIVQNMMYLLNPKRAGKAQRSRFDASHLLAVRLQEHWNCCNIYTVHVKHIQETILALYVEFISLFRTRKGRKNERFSQVLEDFNKQANQLFDVFCMDEAVRRNWELLCGSNMTDLEFKFLEDQRSDRKMVRVDFVDRKWMKTMDPKRKDLLGLENRLQDAGSQMNVNGDAIAASTSSTISQVSMTTCIRPKGNRTLGKVDYHEQAEFPPGILPTQKDVIQNMLYLLSPKRAGKAQRSRDDASQLLAERLQEHWNCCNIYTVHVKHIQENILAAYVKFMSLCQTRTDRQNERYFRNIAEFNEQAEKLFDVFCRDEAVKNKKEILCGLPMPMTDMIVKFLQDQRSDRKMVWEHFVVKKR
ncbi:uncharacterized protein LOC117293082 isoform X2 [Asterias rubens]|uniref:uncharacterized protein LOC117293082 isoform X2 n=1 Tax=Asterias rubens TaxID=7604 RepID=UPI0014558D37|nr:uncharacterized protein LOC117293082 isoform X2 [Asterias rubens]